MSENADGDASLERVAPTPVTEKTYDFHDRLRARIRAAIAVRGISQAELARAVEMDPAALSKSLGGTRRLSSLELARIAERLKVPTSWLLSMSGCEDDTVPQPGWIPGLQMTACALRTRTPPPVDDFVTLGELHHQLGSLLPNDHSPDRLVVVPVEGERRFAPVARWDDGPLTGAPCVSFVWWFPATGATWQPGEDVDSLGNPCRGAGGAVKAWVIWSDVARPGDATIPGWLSYVDRMRQRGPVDVTDPPEHARCEIENATVHGDTVAVCRTCSDTMTDYVPWPCPWARTATRRRIDEMSKLADELGREQAALLAATDPTSKLAELNARMRSDHRAVVDDLDGDPRHAAAMSRYWCRRALAAEETLHGQPERAATEPRDPAVGDHVLLHGRIVELGDDGATVALYRSSPTGQTVVMQPGALDHNERAGVDDGSVPAGTEST